MIQRKKKICIDCGTPQYLFGHKRCKYHYDIYMRNKTDKTAQKRLSSKSGYNIPQRTEKRSEEEKQYLKLIKEIDKEAELTKQMDCFFCGQRVGRPCDHHHLKNRENEHLIDRVYIVRVHRKCHSDYHNLPVKKLKWFMTYVSRLTKIDPVLAERELMKLSK